MFSHSHIRHAFFGTVSLLLALAPVGCSTAAATPNAAELAAVVATARQQGALTALAQVTEDAIRVATGIAQTLTAQPTAPFTASATATLTAAPSPTPTATLAPTLTRPPVTLQPAATSAPPTPDFLATAAIVKMQIEGFGGLIDEALQQGYIDCQNVVNQYTAIFNAPTLNVPGDLAGAYQLYSDGVNIFTTKARDLNQNCVDFMANPSGDEIPFQQWGLARQGVNEAVDKLRQAITSAGGTP